MDSRDKILKEMEQLKLQLEKQQNKIKQQEKELKEKNILIENLLQAVRRANKKYFGSSSESTKEYKSQLSLFEEDLAEKINATKNEIAVKSYTRTPRKPGVREEILKDLPVKVIECDISKDEKCPKCGKELIPVGKELVRKEVEYIPAKIQVKQYIRNVYKCKNCGTGRSLSLVPTFVKGKVPKPLLNHSIISPSLLAWIMYQKFEMGIPLNRQEKDWLRLGLILPRTNMAHWINRVTDTWLKPVYEKLREEICASEIIHCDETRIQCNHEEGKKASSQSFVWVIRPGKSEKKQGVYFQYTKTRKGENAKAILKGFTGTLITDGYSGYNKIPDIKHALCWTHMRRYWINSIPLDSSKKEIPGSQGAKGREYCNKIFNIERKIEKLLPDEKLKKRQELTKPVLDAYWSWVEEISEKNTTNDKLIQAITYAKNQRKNLETFMTDGKIPCSNNIAEQAIRPFAVGRRAWLFADTPKGANGNAIAYSLTESARANGLNSFAYLKYVLEQVTIMDLANQPELVEKLMPWSDELPAECYVKANFK